MRRRDERGDSLDLGYVEPKPAPFQRQKGAAPKSRVLDSTEVAPTMTDIAPAIFRSNRIDVDLLARYTSQDGQSLAELAERPLFLVFLRHFGCTFCREAVDTVSKTRREIEAGGSRLAFVHLGTEEKAQWFFKPYGLLDVPRFSDPEGPLYQAFGLLHWEWRQYLNSESILRMVLAWTHGHFTGIPAGDIQRMPGAFLMDRGEIQKAFRHKLVSDRPDYVALATPN